MTKEKTYIGPYKVMKVFRVSKRRQVLRTGLTLAEAQRVTRSYPDSDRSMVFFTKQYSADKYFI